MVPNAVCPLMVLRYYPSLRSLHCKFVSRGLSHVVWTTAAWTGVHCCQGHSRLIVLTGYGEGGVQFCQDEICRVSNGTGLWVVALVIVQHRWATAGGD